MSGAGRGTMNRRGSVRLPVLVFTVTLFLSAFLLFSIQPMVGKMVLPRLGGTPAVWNTCMVFFQAVLLAGYGYAHLMTRWLGSRRQASWHLVLLLLPILSLPIGLPASWVPPTDTTPLPWLLRVLAIGVGLPFFLVSTSAPLLQKWFSDTRDPSAHDPYFLYAASNLGSFTALVSYPIVIEPAFRLITQSRLWTAGYWLFALLVVGCAQVLWRSAAPDVPLQRAPQPPPPPAPSATAVSWTRRGWWILLALAPSSLLLGVTTYLSTDLAPIPLLWVVPLALYLLSFVLVFAKRPPLSHMLVIRVLPFVVLPLCIALILRTTKPIWLLIPLHLLMFFVSAMVCHGELAKDRPSTHYLTEFYFWISVGGVLGGMFNALIAPLLFDTVIEYPLMMFLVCLLRPGSSPTNPRPRTTWMDLALPIALGVLIAGQILGARAVDVHNTWPAQLVIFGLSSLLCYSFSRRPIRFGLGIGMFLLAGLATMTHWHHLLHQERSFFGVYRVARGAEGHALFHGTTLHGLQSHHPAHMLEPLTYFHASGPLGDIVRTLRATSPDSPVAVIGLGTGSMACHAEPQQRWTFYEIDPLVVRIATNPWYFTFLRDCPGIYDLVLGDARLSLAAAPDHHYRLIAIDAFSSDAIPVHLLTREAIDLYVKKLRPRGLLAFHISNRHLRLKCVLGDIAAAEGMIALRRNDGQRTEEQIALGKQTSEWVVLAHRREDVDALADNPQWTALQPRPNARVWTDDFSNVFGVFRWR